VAEVEALADVENAVEVAETVEEAGTGFVAGYTAAVPFGQFN
jgi:hypothetical protein